MNVLDKYFQIFREGSEDQKFRQRALDVFKRVLEDLRTLKTTDLDTPKAGKNIVSLKVGETLDDADLDDLHIWFVMRDDSIPVNRRAMFVGSSKTDYRRIEIYVDVPSTMVPRMTPEIWKRVIAKNGAKVFERVQEIFWHEFVHYMDFKRMHPVSRSKAFGKTKNLKGVADPGKYFNDPIELNAFIQQGLGRVQNHLANAGSKEEVEKVIGKSPNDFYRLMLKVLSPGFAKNLTDRNKNKLKKRVAQMWTDTMKRFGGCARVSRVLLLSKHVRFA